MMGARSDSARLNVPEVGAHSDASTHFFGVMPRSDALSRLRRAVTSLEKEGHFTFKVEPKITRIYIRQVASRNQREDLIQSHAFPLSLLNDPMRMSEGELVEHLRSLLTEAGFDLEREMR